MIAGIRSALSVMKIAAPLHLTVCFVAAGWFFLDCSNPAFGNSGPVSTSAVVVGEPLGLTKVVIESEKLVIDLRPIEQGKPATVSASYQLRNDFDPEVQSLAFAFGSNANANHEVRLNGQVVEGYFSESSIETFQSWWPPLVTPSLMAAEEDLPFRSRGWRSIKPLFFECTIPSGSSELVVHYQEHATIVFDRPTMYRQFAYLLSPAKNWSAFGTLNVELEVPEGWSVACVPEMVRQGETLKGSYSGLPADSISITLRPPVPFGYQVIERYRVPLLVLLGMVCVWVGARSLHQRTKASFGDHCTSPRGRRKLFISLVVIAILVGLCLQVGTWCVLDGINLLYPMPAADQLIQAGTGVGDGYLFLFHLLLSCVAGMIGFSLSGLLGLVIYYRSRRLGRDAGPVAS